MVLLNSGPLLTLIIIAIKCFELLLAALFSDIGHCVTTAQATEDAK